MTQYLLDANALLRYLRNDVPKQAEEVAALFAQAKQFTVQVKIPVVALLEVVFILSKHYQQEKSRVGSQVFDIVTSPILDTENRETVKKALLLWKTADVSFADCLVAAQATHEGKILFTFDKKLQQLAAKLQQ